MNDSSATRTEPFDGLEWRHVRTMLSVLRECDYTKKEYIKKQYTQYASHFGETLAFMARLRAVGELGGHLRLTDVLRISNEADSRAWMVQRLFASRNRYRKQIFDYLSKFHIAEGEPLYRPSSASRHHHSHVRNFLMEMGIVRHDTHNDYYRIAPEYIDLYVVLQDKARKRTPASLAAVQRNRDTLGTAAEEAIVSYERHRVGSRFADCVEHVALLNAAAGYDVRSVTVNEDGMVAPRYIEVKAVSGSSLQFYWTCNEVLTAKVLAQWYYLYLLPVKGGGRFAINELEIIMNPHVSVLKASDEWALEPDVLRCCLRQESTHLSGAPANE